MKILKIDENLVCVEFAKISGDQFTYIELFKEIKTALNCFNDAITN